MTTKTQLIGSLPQKNAGNNKKKKRKISKEIIRKEFLSKIPKGGVAIEIGVWQGDFSETILDFIEPASLTLIDPWAHIETDTHTTAFVGRTDNNKMERIFNKVVARYKTQIDEGEVNIIRDFSVPALKLFADDSISFAYVDGDHSYEGVKSDLVALFPKMKPGGVMAFDDYHRRGWWGDGVIRAINEFLGQHPSQLRVLTVVGAQIAIQKIAPLETVEDKAL